MPTRFGCVLCALSLSACTAQLGGEELDPSASLAGEEWTDEGPPPGEEAIDEEPDGEYGTLEQALVNGERFELPFPCGQVWAGQSRTGHSPQNALDFNRTNDIGDSVVAAASGRVTRVENLGNRSYGRWIEIDHGDGYRTRYAHLSAQAVSVGQRVSQGQRIGAVGDTGGSFGPHLHYEVRRNGIALRPTFHGVSSLFFGTRNYTSQNSCGGGGGGGGSTTAVTGRVNTAGAPLTIRAGASTDTRAVGSVADGASVRITCQKYGQSVRGTYGTSTLWDFVGTGYVSDAYVSTGSDGRVARLCN
jgi:murein DD-endopeptidase MepM/ murein hydrolase activator NlpD